MAVLTFKDGFMRAASNVIILSKSNSFKLVKQIRMAGERDDLTARLLDLAHVLDRSRSSI